MLKLLIDCLKRNFLKKPVSYVIFITGRCNSRCGHCFYWKHLNKFSSQELTFSELEKFSKEIGIIYNLDISGGEPFLRKDLADIVLLFARNNRPRHMDIPTNCLLPKRIFSVMQSILKQKSSTEYSISLSLDGLQNTHDSIRGVPGNFKKVMETYRSLIPLHHAFGLTIKVSTTLMNKNINEIKELGLYVKTHMSGVSFHNFEIMRGHPRDRSFFPPDYKDLVRIQPVITNLQKGYSFYGNRWKAFAAGQLKEHIFDTYKEIVRQKRQVVPCLAYFLNSVLDEKGNVYFCELTPAIGNIRTRLFSQILKSEKAREMRKRICQGTCFCTHSCFMQKSIYLNPSTYPKICVHKMKQFGRYLWSNGLC
jgi:MoaA/NifB/PqqE/SkfB family radical SAM enzyme